MKQVKVYEGYKVFELGNIDIPYTTKHIEHFLSHTEPEDDKIIVRQINNKLQMSYNKHSDWWSDEIIFNQHSH